MAAKSVIQFVLGQFAKRSARKTGIPKILNANDSIVQSNAMSIEKTLKNYGYDPSKMSSDDILKAMNYHKAMMNQKLTQQFKGLELSKGVDDLAKKDPFQGFTPKIVPKDKTLLRDSPEAIAKIKADNKAALERLKNKKKTVEDFSDDGDFDPSGMASGGLARVGMYAGGIPKGLMAVIKFLQKKFGKKALYKGDEVVIDNKIFKLSNKKRQMTADELEDFEMDIGDALEGYDFDGTVGSAERILKEQKAYEAAMYRDYKAGRLDPKPGEPNRKRFLEKKLEEMEMSGDKKLMTREEIEELSSFDLGTEMDEAIKKSKTLTPEDELRREFPGIDDNMIRNILTDKNPQRIAEVKQTMREALKMQEKGMSPDEIIKLFKDTTRTKQASGGLANILGV